MDKEKMKNLYKRLNSEQELWLEDYWYCDICGKKFPKSQGAVQAGFGFCNNCINDL